MPVICWKMKNTQTTISARLTPRVQDRRRARQQGPGGGAQGGTGDQVAEREAAQRIRHEWQRGADVGGVVPEQEAAQGREQRQRPVERRGYTLVQFSENVSPACCDASHANVPSPAAGRPNQGAVPRPSAACPATCSRPGMRRARRRLARAASSATGARQSAGLAWRPAARCASYLTGNRIIAER